MTGKINSIQSLGTVDGPGVRFVVFLQGCPLRCKCCHNPDTWDCLGGKEISAQEIAEKATRYKSYFGALGGITLSGGEPLIQSEFAKEVFSICKQNGINTCLDTSGSILNNSVLELLKVTDRVLLDIKYTTNEEYLENVGCTLDSVLEFLGCLEQMQIPTTLRQVIIPTKTDNKENVLKLKEIAEKHSCVDKIELLPFRKLCQAKYDNLGIEFPFGKIDEPTKESMDKLNENLK